jgi:uncharacterized protein
MERRILLLQAGFILLAAWLHHTVASLLYFPLATTDGLAEKYADLWELRSVLYDLLIALQLIGFVLFVRIMGHRWRWLEILVIALVVVTWLFEVLMPHWEEGTAEAYGIAMLMLITSSIRGVVFVGYIIVRSGWPRTMYGVTRFEFRDFSHGVALALVQYIPYYMIVGPVAALLMESFPHVRGIIIEGVFSAPPSNSLVLWSLIFLAMLANSFAEEVAFRALLIPIFERLFNSAVVAVILSTLLFASYHLYQGFYAVWAAFLTGAIFGWYFVTHKRLWPLIVAHTLTNMGQILFYY